MHTFNVDMVGGSGWVLAVAAAAVSAIVWRWFRSMF